MTKRGDGSLPRVFRSATDSEVGYGRPPREYTWKPGQSGNPRGRRKRLLDVREQIQQVYLRKLPVQDGRRKWYVPKIVLLYTKLLNDGLKGDRAAALAAAKMATQFGVYDFRERLEVDFSVLTKEEREICSKATEILQQVRRRSPKSGADSPYV